MFRLINPFVLAHNLQNDNGCQFTVESIRANADFRIRLLLRNVTNNSPCSVDLTSILGWKIVSNGRTVSEHLRLCLEEAYKWLEGFNVNQLQCKDIEDADRPQIPYFINRDELLRLEDKLRAERHPKQMLRQILEEDNQLLKEPYGSGPSNDRPLKVFIIKPSGDRTYSIRIAHIQAAIRTANRIISAMQDISDPNTIIESYLMAAIEEHCQYYIRESLQRFFSGGGLQPDTHMTFVVSMEPIGNADTNNIVFEKHSYREVHIKIPCIRQKKLAKVKVRSINNTYDLYERLERGAKSKNGILAEGIIRLKKSIDTLSQVGWLRFDTLNELNQWLEDNLRATNPDVASSLAAILQWLKSGCKNLPEKEHKTNEELKKLVANKIKPFCLASPVRIMGIGEKRHKETYTVKGQKAAQENDDGFRQFQNDRINRS
jgi:hypothetical protein